MLIVSWKKWWETVTGERKRKLHLVRVYRNDQAMQRNVEKMEQLVEQCPSGREKLCAINDLFRMRHMLTVARIRSCIGEATAYVESRRRNRYR